MRGSNNLYEKSYKGVSKYFITLAGGFTAVIVLILLISWGISSKPVTAGDPSDVSVSGTDADLAKYREQIKALEAGLVTSESKIKQQTDKISAVTKIRNNLAASLEARLKSLGLNLEVDKSTGDVRFGEGLLFDPNSDAVNLLGTRYLDTFVPVYLSTVFSSEYKAYVDLIMIEGHADDEGSYTANLDLAQRRAASVAKLIVSRNLGTGAGISDIEKYLSISSRSNTKPVINDGKIDKTKSRRVEFKFQLKEDKIIEELKKAAGDG